MIAITSFIPRLSKKLDWTLFVQSILAFCFCFPANAILANHFILDTIPPVFDILPQDITIECDGHGNVADLEIWLEAHGNASVSSECGDSLVWENLLVSEETICGETSSKTYRFIVTDTCGNNNNAQAQFVTVDNTAPQIFGGSSVIYDCFEDIGNLETELIIWLATHASAFAEDNCQGGLIWDNDFSQENWVEECPSTRYIDVEFKVTDMCGNANSKVLRFGAIDTQAPIFQNCDRPPITAVVPDGLCDIFVNFTSLIVTDNCGVFDVTQIDDTNLSSGSLFPIGLTQLEYQAEDACGNIDYCKLDIIVNDNDSLPNIECYEELYVESDEGQCGAFLEDIAPLNVIDNCNQLVATYFKVNNEFLEEPITGVVDASGVLLPPGENSIQYTVQDQPILLITEAQIQESTLGVEITNFGPASYNIGGLTMKIDGVTIDTSFSINEETILGSGETFAQYFSGLIPGATVGISISFEERFIDGLALNGNFTINFPFEGEINSDHVFRTSLFDTDSAEDWKTSRACEIAGIGELNPNMQIIPGNGFITSLQSKAPNINTCSFVVHVADAETPFCAEYDTTTFETGSLPRTIRANQCSSSSINVFESFVVGDVNLKNLSGDLNNATSLSIALTSPSGTKVYLIDNECQNTPFFNINLDDESQDNIQDATCVDLMQGKTFQPVGSFKDFFGEDAIGSWTLEIFSTGNTNGRLLDWDIDILELIPYTQESVEKEIESGSCSTTHTWRHPLIEDNCYAGTLTIEFISDDNINVPENREVIPGTLITEFFEAGMTTIQYTIVDIGGRRSMCSFDMIINDIDNPIIDLTTCKDVFIQLEATECTSFQSITPPLFSDNCSVANFTFSPTPEEGLSQGDNETIFTVTDHGGNTASCIFDVIVLENIVGSPQLDCPDTLAVFLGPNCEVTVEAGLFIESEELGCLDNYVVFLEDENGQLIGSSGEGTNVLDYNALGTFILTTLCNTDNINGNCCSSIIEVKAEPDPELICVADKTVVCDESIHPEILGYPELISCDNNIIYQYVDEVLEIDSCESLRSQITRYWTLEDSDGNLYECEQLISIANLDLEQVIFPEDLLMEEGYECEEIVTLDSLVHPNSSGYPKIGSMLISESNDGICSYTVDWQDELIFGCRGSYDIRRTWTIQNLCLIDSTGTNVINHIQNIQVQDTNGPEINNCPQDMTISTDPWNCYATLDLDEFVPEIADACGGIEFFQVFVGKGSVIQNPDDPLDVTLANLDVGPHQLRIRAEDFCDNISTCEFLITVEDKVAPVMECIEAITVKLELDGSTSLFAANLDDGFYDNCDPISTQIYRQEVSCEGEDFTNPSLFVKFCCNDVANDNLSVVLRAWDDGDNDGTFGTSGDNYSECNIEVTVEELAPPDLICRVDVTLDCSDDIQTILNGDPAEILGNPIIQASCGMTNLSFNVDANLADCGTGEIFVVWSAIDAFGDNQSCIQTVTVDPFNNQNLICEKIQFPAGSAENDLYGSDFWCTEIPDSVGVPSLLIQGCENFSFTYPEIDFSSLCSATIINITADTIDSGQDEFCKTIIVHWEIIDACVFDENFGDTLSENPDPFVTENGYFERIVKYDIVDQQAPQIICGEDITVSCGESYAAALTAEAIDACSIDQDFSWTWQIDLFNDGFMEGFGFTDRILPSFLNVDSFEPGSHKITWNLTDGCGNVKSENCILEILENDIAPPTANCIQNGEAFLNDLGEAIISAVSLASASSDNCTASSNLEFSFSPSEIIGFTSLDCDDIENGVNGEPEKTIYVYDQNGNVDSCVASLILWDLGDVCQNQTQAFVSIDGNIYTESGEFVSEAQISLSSNHPEYPIFETTDESGFYEFELNPIYYSYELNASRNFDFLDGVSTLDLVIIQKHILGFAFLNSPYKVIASDINNDERISAIDLVLLRKLILGLEEQNNFNESWRFVDVAHNFDDIFDPFPFKETIELLALSEDSEDNNFIGVKIGDVNSSYTAGLISSHTEVRSNDPVDFRLERENSHDKTILHFYLLKEELIQGFQFSLSLESDIIDILPGQMDLNQNNFNLNKGQKAIPVSWTAKEEIVYNKQYPIFSLVLDHDSPLKINSEILRNEVYVGPDLIIRSISLIEGSETTNEFTLFQNQPNPFIEHTAIKYFAAEPGIYTLNISDIAGRNIFSERFEVNAGYHLIELDKSDLKEAGIYFYSLSYEASVQINSLIKLK